MLRYIFNIGQVVILWLILVISILLFVDSCIPAKAVELFNYPENCTKVKIEGYLNTNSELVVVSAKTQSQAGEIQSMNPETIKVLVQGMDLTAKNPKHR